MPSSTQNRGTWGEKITSWYLQGKGYKIIITHFTTRFGEIDLIAKDQQQVVFIEVKTRIKNPHGLPEQAVNRDKKNKIRKTILAYISQKKIKNFRVDVVSIIRGRDQEKIIIRHHKAIPWVFNY